MFKEEKKRVNWAFLHHYFLFVNCFSWKAKEKVKNKNEELVFARVEKYFGRNSSEITWVSFWSECKQRQLIRTYFQQQKPQDELWLFVEEAGSLFFFMCPEDCWWDRQSKTQIINLTINFNEFMTRCLNIEDVVENFFASHFPLFKVATKC